MTPWASHTICGHVSISPEKEMGQVIGLAVNGCKAAEERMESMKDDDRMNG
jgi:hypothetical protein